MSEPTDSNPNLDLTHRTRMQQLQAEQRERRKQATDPGRGLVLVHTGHGKGKSTSAFGVMARALGWGHRVAVVQFIKGSWQTGERRFFEAFPEQVTWKVMGEGFTWDTQDRERDTAAAAQALATAAELLASGDYDLVVLDEVNIALRYAYLEVDQVLNVLRERAERTSVILTGRDAKPEIMDYADLVSEMQEIKHPYQAGIRAQQGLDF